MENRDVQDHGAQEWRNLQISASRFRKNCDHPEDCSDRSDSGFESLLSNSMGNSEDRSSTGSSSMSFKSRHQVCRGSNNTELEQKTEKLTLSDSKSDSNSMEHESGYYSRDTYSFIEETSQETSLSFNESFKPSFLNSFAQSNDIRYLLAPLWRCLIAPNQDGDTCLHLAIINCQERGFNAIVDVLPKKEFLDIYNDLTQTPLHLAVITRQPEVIQKLIDCGASIDLPDRNGQTCVHLACQRGDLNSLKAIIAPRPEKPEYHEKLQEVLETRNFEGLTPLHVAVSERNVDLVKELITFGANVNANDGKSGHTPLHLAVEQNNLPMVSLLLFEGNANPNALSFSWCTPLHLAAGLGLQVILATLMAAGGDLTKENSEGDTIYEVACGVEDIFDCGV